ncbi:hypothetical protein Tco_0799357 [Tanacetum coccineum]|uniref:Uncharacterized protein n=1 Tax=Tanacetum coccineum TaxID=301880 RepID=A0ABQ4ZQ48_9ASTR
MNVFVRIGFDSTIELVSFDKSQVVTFNGKFICGFRNDYCGTGSQSDNTVGRPHGFIIHGIEVLKGNKKVTEVIDVENWRVDNSRLLRWIISLFEWNSSVLSTKSSIIVRPGSCNGSTSSELEAYYGEKAAAKAPTHSTIHWSYQLSIKAYLFLVTEFISGDVRMYLKCGNAKLSRGLTNLKEGQDERLNYNNHQTRPDLTEGRYSAFKVKKLKQTPKALVSVDTMDFMLIICARLFDATAEFSMMGISLNNKTDPLAAGDMLQFLPTISKLYIAHPIQCPDIEANTGNDKSSYIRDLCILYSEPKTKTKDFPPAVDIKTLTRGRWGTAVKDLQHFTLEEYKTKFRSLRVNGDLINPHGFTLNDPQGRLKSRGIVKFGGGDGRISGKGTIRTSKLDFENVYYVEELQHFNLFSVSQICDKKNKVLFTDTECLVLTEDF